MDDVTVYIRHPDWSREEAVACLNRVAEEDGVKGVDFQKDGELLVVTAQMSLEKAIEYVNGGWGGIE